MNGWFMFRVPLESGEDSRDAIIAASSTSHHLIVVVAPSTRQGIENLITSH